MALSETIADLASRVEQALMPVSSREAYLLYVLRGMPHYRNVGRLDAWEEAFVRVAPPRATTPREKLIDSLLVLGTSGLYQAFDQDRVRRHYAAVLQEFAMARIAAPQNPDLSGW